MFAAWAGVGAEVRGGRPTAVDAFLKKQCLECHDAETKKGGLDLTGLTLDLSSASVFNTWVRVHDRVQAGEMPPSKQARPDVRELVEFTGTLGARLMEVDQQRIALQGRATLRRPCAIMPGTSGAIPGR